MWKNVVLIPCRNEEAAIAQTIEQVKRYHPSSEVVVIDNGSTDETAVRAKNAGAKVVFCEEPGKGRALREGLKHVDADSFTFVDGDGTYDLSRLSEMVDAIKNGADMAVGVRRATTQDAYPAMHVFGNWLFTTLLKSLFRKPVNDVLTGLRVLSRDFIEYSPLMVNGFEVEAYYTLEAAVRDLRVKEFEIEYGARLQGSESKLRSFRDGFKILWCVLDLFRVYRPMHFFALLATACFTLSCLSGSRPIIEFINEGFVHAVPRAVLAAALMNLSFLFIGFGLVLSHQMRYHLWSIEITRRQRRQERPTASSSTPKAA